MPGTGPDRGEAVEALGSVPGVEARAVCVACDLA